MADIPFAVYWRKTTSMFLVQFGKANWIVNAWFNEGGAHKSYLQPLHMMREGFDAES